MDRVEASLQRIEVVLAELSAKVAALPTAADYAALRADVARIEGRLANTPTSIQLFAFMITTWAAGAAIVFAIVRLTP